MKNLSYVFYSAIVVWIFGSLFFADEISNWNINRRNKKISEEGLQRLVDEYGLKIQDPIEDFNQCNYHYSLHETMLELNQVDKNKFSWISGKKLIDKDVFMVNCIPVIQEVLDKCDCFRNENECKFVPVDKRINSANDCYEVAGLSVFK